MSDEMMQPGGESPRGREAARLFVDAGVQADAAVKKGRGLRKHSTAAVVVLLGGGLIYGMRVMGTGPASASAAAVKYDPKDQPRVEALRFRSAIERLEQSNRPVQLSEFTPSAEAFRLPVPEAPPTVTKQTVSRPSGPDAAELERRRSEEARLAEERRAAELGRMAGVLRVQSIMQGSVAVARINGLPVRVGSVIEGFRVVEIAAASVTVEAEGRQFVRPLERDGGPGGR